jgi:hypothetical protein
VIVPFLDQAQGVRALTLVIIDRMINMKRLCDKNSNLNEAPNTIGEYTLAYTSFALLAIRQWHFSLHLSSVSQEQE